MARLAQPFCERAKRLVPFGMKHIVSKVVVWTFVAALMLSPVALLWIGWQWLTGIESEHYGAVIAGIAALGVTGGTFWGNQRTERKRSVEEHSRKEKIAAYSRLNEMFLTKVMLAPTDERATEEEVLQFFQTETANLMLYASNGVIKKWGTIRTTAFTSGGVEGAEMLTMWEDFFKEMRKDVGHSALGLQKGAILKMFVNDIDQHF